MVYLCCFRETISLYKHFNGRPQTCVLRQTRTLKALVPKQNIRCRSDKIIKKINFDLADGISGFLIRYLDSTAVNAFIFKKVFAMF